jgi:tetratricopeptide (TPR) repeat protein
MTRTALLIAALTMVPSFAAAQPGGVEGVGGAEIAAAPEAEATTVVAPEVGGLLGEPGAEGDAGEPGIETAVDDEGEDEGYAEDAEAEEEDYGDVEFCGGGGEESVVDLAYYEMQDGRLARAREMLVTALREGAVDEWQRGHALATLAEVQLRMRHYAQAVLNYQKALRVDPDNLPATVRVGLASALYFRGARARAHELALEVRDEVCGDRWSMVECFAANSVLVRTSRDAGEIEAARSTLSELRTANPDLATSFDEVEARLDRRRVRRAGADRS